MTTATTDTVVRVALVPDLTVTTLALKTLLGEAGALPGHLRLRLLAAIHSRAGREALRPILVRSRDGRRQMPAAVAPITPTGDLALETQVEALRSYGGDTLPDDLAGIYPDHLPAPWRVAADNPAVWSRALADVMSDVWTTAGRPAWRRARPMLDHEFRRVGLALARGDQLALLNSLSARLGYRDDTLSIDGRVEVPIAGRRLLLAPMITPSDAIVVERDHPEVVVVGYALPHAAGAWDPAVVPPDDADDALATVMGRSRARLLRLLGHRKTTMTGLATRMGLAPSTLTTHCTALESAGLITRRREGKTVLVSRTPRGAELVDLFG